MIFKTQKGNLMPCQVIGLRGFHKHLFVWAHGAVQFLIYEYETGLPISSGKTLDEAVENSIYRLLKIGEHNIPKWLGPSDVQNDIKDYGFSKPKPLTP